MVRRFQLGQLSQASATAEAGLAVAEEVQKQDADKRAVRGSSGERGPPRW